ncbi:MAG: HEAT repeat domain-containing protein [Candidatus Obscuribacterales bacterium]|nr:HEAT repeat domain-containing protein [Candidatus Obscuribacterales bacterium]
MNLEKLAGVVEELIVQLDYPGFEPRSLKLGLPEELQTMSAKTFASALGHESVYVKLAALRWFQERPGVAKSHLAAILGLIDSSDEWVRMESIRAVEKMWKLPPHVGGVVSKGLTDQSVEVRKATAKALGKILKRSVTKDALVIDALKQATQDSNVDVRFKAQKALRNIGEFVV